jgi:hypothetical protein
MTLASTMLQPVARPSASVSNLVAFLAAASLAVVVTTGTRPHGALFADAFPSSWSVRKEPRYFEELVWAPPLNPVEGGTYAATAAARTPYAQANLPILYTNDPKAVSRWLSDHVPRDGCVLGFDVEVRRESVHDAAPFLWILRLPL